MTATKRQAQGPSVDLALHTLGWKAFQDLCAYTCEEVLRRPVEIYREAQDGGQDALFISNKPVDGEPFSVATIQCKFSTDPRRRLRLSDLTVEDDNIRQLVSKNEANTYVFMSSCGVDAPVALAMRAHLRGLGVSKPHVLGKEFITKAIRSSARLRALVPRVYGLGDLSLILDERRGAQTKALLGHMAPVLSLYVPTKPHVQAVKALSKHGFVLLLGDPATGKSTIAAILATFASEKTDRPCYKADGPEGLLDSWNPNDPGGFFWVDDAFGPNQLREDFVDRWIAIMPKVQAAVAAGNRFVLTSRRHIYEAAKVKLGSRNYPLLRESGSDVIINVGDLTLDEKRQILYNHIKAGGQPQHWKARVKPQLDSLAGETRFIPEIARRLSDPAYTGHISTANDQIIRFIREPKEHLLQTIRELTKLDRAALTLIFLHRGQMPSGAMNDDMLTLIIRHFAVDAESIGRSLTHLRGSFLAQITLSGHLTWTFKHPTIADAIGAMLGETEGMIELYLRGTRSETIVAEAICAGMSSVRDAVVVPTSLDSLLVERLAELPDDPAINRQLFTFLYERATDKVFCEFLDKHGMALERNTWITGDLYYHPVLRVRERAFRFNLLSNDLRADAAEMLESAIIDRADTSFLDEDDILALFRPLELVRLIFRIRDEVLPNFPDMATAISDDPELDIEPEENFEDLRSKLRTLTTFFEYDDAATEPLSGAEAAIERAIADVDIKKKEAEAEEEKEEEDSWNWATSSKGLPTTRSAKSPLNGPNKPRSLFSDVDE